MPFFVRSFLIFISLAPLCACTSQAIIDYDKIVKASTDQPDLVAHNGRQAIKLSTPLSLRPPNEDNKRHLQFHLTLKDPVFQFGDFVSNYRLVKLEGHANQKFSVKVASFLPFKIGERLMVSPITYLMNSKGEKIPYNYGTVRFESSYILFEMVGTFETDDEYYIFIAADNSSPGSIATSSPVNSYIYWYSDVRYVTATSPIGKIGVTAVLE